MNRTADYAKKNDGRFVSVDDCKKIENELDWIDEKLANVNLALGKIKQSIVEKEKILLEEDPNSTKRARLDGYIDGLSMALNIIESEKCKILRRRV